MPAITSAHYPPIVVMEKYITQEAPKYGIDPKIAVRVAKAEGLNKDGAHLGFIFKDPKRYSYGPFQLRTDGFGNNFNFGKHPTNLDWKGQIRYALDLARNHGWGGWYGAVQVGISDYCGINGGKCKRPTAEEYHDKFWHEHGVLPVQKWEPHHTPMSHSFKQ